MKLFLTQNRFNAAAALLALSAIAGCAPSNPDPGNPASSTAAPVVNQVTTSVVRTDRVSANVSLALTTNEIKVTAVVDKQALLSQEFLYGADVQYTSLYDKTVDLYQQSMSIGHVPASFRIAGNELQLIANNTRLYPSAVNHPGQLIARFAILSQTDKTLTIGSADSRVYLAEIFGGATNPAANGMTDPTAKPARDLWVRSFDFVPKGNYVLQQTSVVMDDGTVAEFMESIFPRANLAQGKSFQTIEMDPDNATGGDDAPFDRFRFLQGETNFNGEHKFAMAQHFDISPTASNPTGEIDWYATPNITDEQMAPVKLAVEGWNRYFKKYKGIGRDVIFFKGRLPDGIHLGDPRYNVINWDSRLVAGAAYESQASDPSTGKMSHSLIYMPAAWLQIGYTYWKNGQYSAEPTVQSVAPAQLALIGGAPQAARLACLRDVRGAAGLLASGRIAHDSVQDFGARLLKDTLFHEVGHALGLAHNFKGSLTMDRKDPKSVFSSSIMDYNDYEIELAAFTATNSADGPQLEYDRQAIDTLYNKGADIAPSDPIEQVCNDAESDHEGLDGVDPVCIRYDIEHDPTQSIGTAWDRINLATKADDVTMAQSVAQVPAAILTPEALAAVKTKNDLIELTTTLAAGLKGSMQFYLTAGKASLARTLKLNIRSLYKFEDGVLEPGYNEAQMRERVVSGMQNALAFKTLPAPVLAAIAQAEKTSLAKLESTAFVKGLAGSDGAKLSDSLAKALDQAVMSITTDTTVGLPAIRAAVLAVLARQPAPFFFGKLEGSTAPLDIEASVVGILGDAVTGADNAARTVTERLAAAHSLTSFRGRPQGDPAINAVEGALLKARAQVTDNDSRELVEALLNALKPAGAETVAGIH